MPAGPEGVELAHVLPAPVQVMVDVDDQNEWKSCIDIGGVRLPTGYFFGASAATGDLSGGCEETVGGVAYACFLVTRRRSLPDNHDIISMKLYQLMVEHSPEEENQDWSKIEPSVSLLKSPKGRGSAPGGWGWGGCPLRLLDLSSRLADNVDDPTGNFRGTPLTGWKVFLLLLCSLLGIVVCAVVGAVVFQKRQERNKRFY